MSMIGKDYRLALIRPDGTVVDTVDAGQLCTRSAFDRTELLGLVEDMVRLEAAKVGVEAERARRG